MVLFCAITPNYKSIYRGVYKTFLKMFDMSPNTPLAHRVLAEDASEASQWVAARSTQPFILPRSIK